MVDGAIPAERCIGRGDKVDAVVQSASHGRGLRRDRNLQVPQADDCESVRLPINCYIIFTEIRTFHEDLPVRLGAFLLSECL